VMTELARAPELDPQLTRALDNLTREFAGVYSRETITGCLHDSLRQLSEAATVLTYLPLLAHRFTHKRLSDARATGGMSHKRHPEVLFVCEHNAGRSQMAAALLDHHGAGRVGARSAGSQPADGLHPQVVSVMAEVGVDLAGAAVNALTTQAVQASDVVVTLGCGDAVPILPGKHYLDWQLEDPADKDIGTVRRIRDDIDARARALLAELGVSRPL
jgi:arsenate reductase